MRADMTPCPNCGTTARNYLRERNECLGCGQIREINPAPRPMSREQLHARIADILRRSGVADAELLVRLMEQDAAEILAMLEHGMDATRRTAAEWRAFGDDVHADPLYERAERMKRCLLGAEIGPPK